MSDPEDYHNLDISKLSTTQLRRLKRDVEYTLDMINDKRAHISTVAKEFATTLPTITITVQGKLYARSDRNRSKPALTIDKNWRNIPEVLQYMKDLQDRVSQKVYEIAVKENLTEELAQELEEGIYYHFFGDNEEKK